MADIPVTEKRLLEILSQMFDKRFEAIDKRFEAIDEKFAAIDARFTSVDTQFVKVFSELQKINGKIDGLQRYQDTESHAIEFELKKVLQKYLTDKYPRMEISPFPIKTINDLSNVPITDLDAAFLVSTSIPKIDYTLLKEKGFPPKIVQPNIISRTSILAIAEAKHNINPDKIATKLYQFDRIKTLIHMLKDVSNNQHPLLIQMAKRNAFLLQISEFRFFFGAAFWHEKTASDLVCDIKKHKRLCNEFKTASPDVKVDTYREICAIQHRWYKSKPAPCNPELSDSEILKLTNIDSSLNQIEIITPSGERYAVVMEKQPNGMPIGGRRNRTRKTT